VLITLFFSLSVSKLPQYVTPVIPLIAIALGAWFDRVAARPECGWGRSFPGSPLRVGVALGIAALSVGSLAALTLGPQALREIEAMRPGQAIATAALLLGWAVALLAAQRRRHLGRLMGATAGGVVTLIVWLKVMTFFIAPNHYCKSLIEHVRPGLDSGATLISSGSYLPTVSFYTGRRVLINGGAGEITFGSRQIPDEERRAWFTEGVDDLRRRLSGPAPVYLLVRDHETAEKLLPQLGEGVQEIVWNKRRSILGNAAAAELTPPLPGGLLGEARRRLP
jgi:hypothetical protein